MVCSALNTLFPGTTLHFQSARLRMLFFTLVGLVLQFIRFHVSFYTMHMDFHEHACSAETADNANMVVAAPVPIPEAGTHGSFEHFGRLLDLSRSEGWGTLRQGLESRLLFDLPEHHSPVNSGDVGQPHGFTSVRKRSYKRAILRARRYGFANYKGRIIHPRRLCKQGGRVGRWR